MVVLWCCGARNEKSVAAQQLARWCNGQGCGVRSPRGRGSIPSWAKSTFRLVSERKKKD